MASYPYLFLIPLLPLLSAAFYGVFGLKVHRRFGEKAVHWPAVLLPWGSFLVSAIGLVTLASLHGEHAALHQSVWSWIHIGALQVDLAFLMDPLSAVMAVVVSLVGSLIHVYSIGYMKGDRSYWRYFSYLNLFMFSMLVLVLADNFLFMFVGWEGVGLCSYLLIAFWYTDREKAAAGMKAFVVNRVGDYGFTVGLLVLFWGLLGVVGATSLNFHEVQQLVNAPGMADRLVQVGLPTAVCLLFFLGATGKSAQIPLYVWLPDAMAGPTPVSALIHAATMVTAGVYMVARVHFLFALSPTAMTVVAVVGALTALFAATIGLFQHDIKKVLAYSTVSQLGFMFMAVGVGAWWVGIFHLVTHAFFKACLFLGSGSVILGCHHEQDMRRLGGLGKLMPWTAASYLLSCFAIAGFPLFSGFFSKDEILWQTFDSATLLVPGTLLWGIGAVAALCTSFYMFRSYYLTFSGTYRGGAAQQQGTGEEAGHKMAAAKASGPDASPLGHPGQGHGHTLPRESPKNMTIVLAVLAFFAVVAGFVGLPHLWHLPNLFEHWLAPVFEAASQGLANAGYGAGVEWTLMAISVVIALAGFFLARWLYRDERNPIPRRLLEQGSPFIRGLHRVVYNKYYVDEAYQVAFVDRATGLASMLAWFDDHVVDGLVNLAGAIGRFFGRIQGAIDLYFVDGLVNLLARTFLVVGKQFRTIQTGRVQSYVYGVMAGSGLLIVILLLVV
ncbi:MAG: NADH-quinone oxidoreductase subunit L [Bradymonadales bacterium]|nr:NADH-quinone oxidoreductase subunit L [Bradymonadales bacterium]